MTHPFYISTFCCMDLSLEKALALLSERTTRVEILADGLHDILSDIRPCSEYPLTYSVHAPTGEINIASVNGRIRQASVAVLDDAMAVCSRIGADHIVVHPGYCPYEQVRSRSCTALCHSLDDLTRLQDEHGVVVCIENMGSWECCHFRTPDFLPLLTSRGLGFVLDCGHARLNGNLDAFLTSGACCHVHLHDNGGASDDHEACGSSTTDFSHVMAQLPRGTTSVIETRSLADADRSILYLSSLTNGDPP